jgi:hypothetical protein
MADVLVANTDVQLSGKTLLTAEDPIVSSASTPSSFTSYINQTGLPRALFFHNTTQSIPDNTLTTPAFNSTSQNIGGFTFDGGNNLIAPVDGTYLVVVTINWTSNATGHRLIQGGGSSFGTGVPIVQAPATTAFTLWQQLVGTTISILGAAPINIQVRQTSGAPLNIGPNHSLRVIKVA